MKTLLSIAIVCLSCYCSAQHEADYWPFGYGAGMNFYSGSPSVDTSSLYGYEGCSVISDGCSILFYTDGATVYNKNHQVMNNGNNLAGTCTNYGEASNTQGALIVSQPGSDSLFYIFTTDCIEDTLSNGLRYSIVDMSMNNGLGQVTIKNQLLLTASTEKLTATRHGDGCDIWILAHQYGNNSFYAYLLSDTGLSNPVVSNTGQIHDYNNICGVIPCIDEQISRGYMKFSKDGSKLVTVATPDDYDSIAPYPPIYGLYPEVFDFDNITGTVISDFVLDDSTYLYYGASFSPDNSKLYLSCAWYGYNYFSGYLHQYDLNAGTVPDIINSRYLVNDPWFSFYPGALQLAYDGKIYCANDYMNYVGAINNPNGLGSACNYNDTAVYMGLWKYSGVGLPNILESYMANNQEADFNVSQTTALVGETIFFTDNSTGASTWKWSFGDGTYSYDQNPTHVYTAPGNYDVSLSINFDCHYDKECMTIQITGEPPSGLSELSDELVNIYPMPVEDFLIIDAPSINRDTELKIYNNLGQIVYRKEFSSFKKRHISMNYSSGIYFVSLESDEFQYKRKIVKQ